MPPGAGWAVVGPGDGAFVPELGRAIDGEVAWAGITSSRVFPSSRTNRSHSRRAFAARGWPRFRARQVFGWIYRKGVTDVESMTNLPRDLRTALATEFRLVTPRLTSRERSSDGTEKFLLELADGRQIESVFIPDTPAMTFCISTQVGCAMGCAFCASGVAGLKRHLTAGEIVAQVLLGRTLLDEGEALRNVVLMGMGEPLHNYDAVARALRLLTHADGLDLSTRRVTVSQHGRPIMEALVSFMEMIDGPGADDYQQVMSSAPEPEELTSLPDQLRAHLGRGIREYLGPVQLVFLSRDPNEHHQIVLASGRPAEAQFNVINQISLRVPDLATLRELHGRVDEPKGDPGNTLTREEITAKALRLAAFSGGATAVEMQAAVDALWGVAEWPRVGPLLPPAA